MQKYIYILEEIVFLMGSDNIYVKYVVRNTAKSVTCLRVGKFDGRGKADSRRQQFIEVTVSHFFLTQYFSIFSCEPPAEAAYFIGQDD